MWILDQLGIPIHRFDTARLTFAAEWPTWFLCLTIAGCVLAMVWTWLTVRRLRRTAAKLSILALRAIAFTCALVILLEPQIQLRKSVRIKNRVAVLVDASASMSVKDQPGRLSRAEAVAEFLRQKKDYFNRLNDQFDVAYFTVGKALTATNLASLRDSPTANQPVTDLIGCLRALAERYPVSPGSAGTGPTAGEGLQAVFLFSDGADNATSADERRRTLDPIIERLHAPIFCLAPGAKKDFCDLAISNVECEDLAFVRTPWTALATVNAIGFKDKQIPVSLMQGRSVIATQTITPGSDQERFRVEFKFLPIETRKTVLTVSVPVYAEEALEANNAFSIPIRIIRDKIRILHLCGRPSWDERFLRQALKQDPSIDLVSLFILRMPTDYRAVPHTELSLIPFPLNALELQHLREFDVVIFQNFNYKPYGLSPHMANIPRFVLEYGGGFIMIGGDLSFSEGLYATSPIADVLPVEIAPQKDQIDPSPFYIQLTEAGRHHPITALDPNPSVNDKIWKGLPALGGCNKVLGLKPNAVALAIHPALVLSPENMPVVAAMEAGRGRSLAVTTDTTWYWGMPALAQQGTTRHYFTFWHNAIRWLLKDPELDRVKIRPECESYQPGDEIKASILVLDSSYRPAPQAPVRLKVAGPAPIVPPLKPDAVTNDAGTIELSFTAHEAGVYSIEATAGFKVEDGALRADGYSVEEKTVSEPILVQQTGSELRDVSIDSELLTYIARKSSARGGSAFGGGGAFMELPAAETFPVGVKIRDPYIARVLEKEDIPLWDNWIALCLLVGVLSVEWWIRKRSGLP